jgi:ketosteroid isomerase-like protein
MAEESTAPDLVERWRLAADALGRSDLDAGLSCFAPDAVWEVRPLAIRFEGIAAIRSFVEDWIGNYDEYHQELVEGHNLGNDVVFALNRQDARLAGTTSRVQELWSFTITWRVGMIDRVIGRNDIVEARAAAERLAEERG